MTSDAGIPQTSERAAATEKLQRPIWLTLLCLLLWSVVAFCSSLVLCGVATGIFLLPNQGDLSLLTLIYGLPLLILVGASIGLWMMTKWGAALFWVYLVVEVVRALYGGLLPLWMLPIGLGLMDTERARALSVIAKLNATYLFFLVCIGVGIWLLWRRHRLQTC